MKIIGTTTAVREYDLPARLAPIFMDGGGQVLLPVGETLQPETCEWIAAHVADGEFALFPEPVVAREGYVLLQTSLPGAPEYLPEDKLPERLTFVGGEALEKAAEAVTAGHLYLAEEHVWYAARALPKEPLPVMVLSALLQETIPAEDLYYLEIDLRLFTEIEKMQALQAKDTLKPLIDLVRRKRY